MNFQISSKKSAKALVRSDKQMFCGKKKSLFDFYCRRLFNLKELGAGLGYLKRKLYTGENLVISLTKKNSLPSHFVRVNCLHILVIR